MRRRVTPARLRGLRAGQRPVNIRAELTILNDSVLASENFALQNARAPAHRDGLSRLDEEAQQAVDRHSDAAMPL